MPDDPPYSASDLALNEASLGKGDAADIALLFWLERLEKAIAYLEPDVLTPALPSLHSLTLTLFTSPPPATPSSPNTHTLPRPGRPIRHALTRALVAVHRKVESRTLFDLVQGLVRFVGEKGDGVGVYRVASWYCIGEIMKNHGTNMMSFMAEICMTTTKVLKTSSSPVLTRTASLSALSKSLLTAGKAVPDALGRELVKTLSGKVGLGDGAGAVGRCCADALVALASHTSAITTLSDIDAITAPAFRALEKADYTTRRGLSRLIAFLLASTQEAGSAPAPAEKKGKKTTGEEDDAVTVVSSAANSGPTTMLSLNEMLKHLSTPFNRPGQARRTRNAILDVYATLFDALGAGFVEAHYAEIVAHIMAEVVMPVRSRSSRYEVLSVRAVVGPLLRDLIGIRLLSEQGQVTAIRELATTYLRKWPVLLPGTPDVHDLVLVVALKEVSGLLEQLGNAAPAVQEVLHDPLLRLAAHPSEAVRVHAAWCLRTYCLTTPLTLPKTIVKVLGDLEKDLALVGTPAPPPDLGVRAVGRAHALAALIAVIPERPLYVSYDVSTRVLDMAVQLLKRAGEHEVAAAEVEVHVAWVLISALMTLGSGFVKLHLPQLLVLWRNALPKPTSKDNSVGSRGEKEWSFLLQVREGALSAILSFLRNNSSKELVTLDVSRRIAALLTNTLNFVNGFATAYAEALREQQLLIQQGGSTSSSGLTSVASRATLVDRENMLRRRILQCFTSLGPSSATESSQPALIQAAVGVIADPDNAAVAVNATQAAIQASAGGFSDVWQTTDGYGFGVTSLGPAGEGGGRERLNELNRDTLEVMIEAQLSQPTVGSLEHDPLELCSKSSSASLDTAGPRPATAATGVVDAGIELFAILLPHQTVETLLQAVTLMTNHLRSPKMEKNPGRRQAVFYNVVVALSRALAVAENGNTRKVKDTLGNPSVTNGIKALLQEAVLDSVKVLRAVGSEGMGSLAAIAGGSYLNTQTQWLVDQIVSNRVPDSRAGCALGLAAIYSHIGGLMGAPLLKSIVSVLMSLSTDPHPVVHYWAMHSLARVIDAASLAYEAYVPSTLGMLATIYLSEGHEPEGGSVGSVNLRGDLPAYQEICKILSALIGVIGPELQEAGRTKSLAFLLVHEFGQEQDEGIAVEAMRCFQQFLMFAPSEVDIPYLVQTFRSQLGSRRRHLKVAAITALYQIVQRDAQLMSKLGGNQLVEDLFALLDEDPSLEGVRQVIISWLQQTSAALPSGWIDLCQRIMNRSTIAPKAAPAKNLPAGFQDDEGQSLGGDTSALSTSTTARWRTQLFALRCLHEVIQAVVLAGRPEQFDGVQARNMNLNPRLLLVSRVADLIRMAFTASTAQTTEVRLQGLVVLRDVIEQFNHSPDPDFEGGLLLEQHQAPIAAALTPSFGPDSAPEVLASAVHVCAVFVGSGVIKEISRMGRILKLLTSALDRCAGTGADVPGFGTAEDLSTNASIMLKISTLTAWAELQIAGTRQPYLLDVVRPHQQILNSLWVGALRDYALIRTDPEADSAPVAGPGMDFAQSGLGREVLLPYYEQASMLTLAAVAVSMDKSEPSVLLAMDGKDASKTTGALPTALTSRNDPTHNFYVVYGLSFEILTKSLGDSSASGAAVPALEAMRTLVRPEFCGSSAFETSLFDELCTLCYRIALSDSAPVKAGMVGVMRSFATSRASMGNQEQIRRVLAVVTFTLRNSISSREVPGNFKSTDTAPQRVAFLNSAFAAFGDIIRSLGTDAAEQLEMFLVGLQLYSDLLRDETGHMDLAGPTLAALKTLLDGAHAVCEDPKAFSRIVHGLLSNSLTNVDAMRGRQGAIATTKIRNNLLTIVLILSTLQTGIEVSRTVVEQACYIIGQKIQDSGEVGMTAIQCSKALILSAARSDPSMQHSVGQLLPQLVRYLAKVAEVADTLKPLDELSLGGQDVLKSLMGFVGSLDDKQRSQVYPILLPTLILLLDPSTPTAPLHPLAVSYLLALASQSPAAFKETTAALDPEARTKMEVSIRQSVAVGREAAGATREVKRAIELKSFG